MFKRILAGIIACMMIVCALPLGVSAAEDGTTTFHFEPAGGEGSMDDIVVTRETASTTFFPKNGFTKMGYEFKKWSTSSQSLRRNSRPGDKFSSLSSYYLKYNGNVVVVEPIWAGTKITVTFDDGMGNKQVRSLVVGNTYSYTYDATQDNNSKKDNRFNISPERDGYEFLGWFTENGEEVGYSYKFKADDDGTTIYAHWIQTRVITLDFNGGTTGYGSSKEFSTSYTLREDDTTIKTVPELTGKAVAGWNTEKDGSGKNFGDPDLSFDEINTLYAQYRDVERTINFYNEEFGSTEVKTIVLKSEGNSEIEYTLPGDTFTKDGHDLVSWKCTEALYGSVKKTVDVGGTYTINFIAKYEPNSYNFYAKWEINDLGSAIEAITNALPTDNEVKSTGSLGLPTSGKGYAISYSSSDTNYIDNDGNVLLLPVDGTKEVTLTATITTADGTYDREFVLTVFSSDSADIQTKLNDALDSILDRWNTVHIDYAENANFCDIMSGKFADNGIDGVKVTITNEPKKFSGKAAIATDGAISFYFYEGLTDYEDNNTRVPFVDIKIEKAGVVIEKKDIEIELDWDFAKVDEALGKAFDRVVIPARVAENATIADLPMNGNDASTVSSIKWTSDNPAIVIGTGTDGKLPVTITHSENSVDVTITASITWKNPHNDQSQTFRTVTKTYTVRVVGTDPTLSGPADYSAVDAALAKAPTDAEKYTAESFAALTRAIIAVERGLTKDDQSRVDAFAKAILEAIDNLVLIPSEEEEEEDNNMFFIILAELLRRKTLTVVADGEVISETTYENGTVIDFSALKDPEMTGYLFTGWFADAELTERIDSIKLERDTTVYAGFEDILGELDADMTADRASAVELLWKIAGKPVVNYILPFADVEEGSDTAEAIRWAASEQIVNGFEDDTFRGDLEITREQLAAMLFRMAKVENAEEVTEIADIADVSDWAADAAGWAVSNGIIEVTEDGSFDPSGSVTVAEVVAAAVIAK